MSLMPTREQQAYAKGMEEGVRVGKAGTFEKVETIARVHKAFELIRDACTVTILSLEEMEQVVLRSLKGEFDGEIRG